MLTKNEASLKSYRRLRPSWKQMATNAPKFAIGSIDEGIPFVGDNFWLLVNATLPDEARKIMEGKRKWSGGGLIKQSELLREYHSALAEQATTANGVVLAKPIALRTDNGKGVTAWGGNDILVLRTIGRDIGVNPRKARWVEKHGKDAGAWYAEPDNNCTPLRYIVDGKVVGLLMPYNLGSVGQGWQKWGLRWDKEAERYHKNI